MEIATLARYPFLPEVSDYLKEKEVSLEDIISSPAFERAREIGRQRVMEALVDGEIGEHALAGDLDYLLELVSYVVARIIVSSTADELLIQRYALAEAVCANRRLEESNIDFIIEIAKILELNISQADNGNSKIHFIDYLKNSSQMRAEEWKLMHQPVEDGFVTLDKRRTIRIIQQALYERISDELPLPVNDQIIEIFQPSIEVVKEEIEKRKKEFQKEGMGKISIVRFPPCMLFILDAQSKGKNIPHVGRFALTAFLHTIGMSTDDILKLFAASPDFNERLARYQIDHITGVISGVEYIPQKCHTMKSQGICFNPDGLCNKEWMTHPLTYYKIKGKRKEQKPEKEEPDEGTEDEE